MVTTVPRCFAVASQWIAVTIAAFGIACTVCYAFTWTILMLPLSPRQRETVFTVICAACVWFPMACAIQHQLRGPEILTWPLANVIVLALARIVFG